MRKRWLILFAAATYTTGAASALFWTRSGQASAQNVGGVAMRPVDRVWAIIHHAEALGVEVSPATLITQDWRAREAGGRALCAIATECYGPGLEPVRAYACNVMNADWPVGWQWMVEECGVCRR